MNSMSINIRLKKTHPDAKLPEANNEEVGGGDTGYDLVAVESAKIPSGGSNNVAVGLTLADITSGYWIRIEPRSGLGFKHSIQPHLGVIDNGYRGDLGVKLYNFGTCPHYVKKGDKIAQLVVYKLLQPTFEFVDSVTSTKRGAKGFGSSDTPAHKAEDLTRPPFAKRTSPPPSETTSTGSETAIFSRIFERPGSRPEINPWTFTDVQALNDWAKENPHVDEEYYDNLLEATQFNIKNIKNV